MQRIQRIPFAALPALGILSDDVTSGPWVKSCQDGASACVIQDSMTGEREFELSISNADVDQKGSRVFHNLPNGQWLTLKKYLGKPIQISWETYIPELDLTDGEGKWMTIGPEVKDEKSPNALIQTNVVGMNGRYYYALNNGGIGSTPIPMMTWHKVTMDILLAVKGSYALTFGDDYLYVEGPTVSAFTTGIAGTAWCMYGNNMRTPNRYIARFRRIAAWLMG